MNSPNRDDRRPLRDLTILVVEDQFLIAIDIESILRDAGAEVLGPYASLSPARTAAEGEAFSAALLDFRLGEETTEEVAGILTARSIPFLFYTGQSLPPSLQGAKIMSKPASRRALVNAIVAAVGPRS